MAFQDDEKSTVETERDILEHGSARPDAPGGGRSIDGASQQGAPAAGRGAPGEDRPDVRLDPTES